MVLLRRALYLVKLNASSQDCFTAIAWCCTKKSSAIKVTTDCLVAAAHAALFHQPQEDGTVLSAKLIARVTFRSDQLSWGVCR